jgi:hypothetical protein
MSQYNALVLRVYSSGTTETVNALLEHAEQISFTQVYPGGKSAGMTFYLARDVTASWSVAPGMRVAAWNGLQMVWEGYISGITPTVGAGRQGMTVICEGAWSRLLQKRKLRKPWADTRIDDGVIVADVISAYPDLCTIDRQNQIKFIPKVESWAAGMYCQVYYSAPTGQTIKRITASYNLQEGAQNWTMGIYNIAAAAVQWSTAVSGASTFDTTLATPSQRVNIYFQNTSGGAQTPTGPSGTIYGMLSNIVIYTETGSINAQEIVKDLRAIASGISSDVSQVGALTVSLVPFVTDGNESLADVAARAVGFGDASFNKWASYLDTSANSADSLPRFILEQQPALTAYDYAVRMDEDNVGSELQFIQDLEPVRNWVAVQYQNAMGKTVFVTPDDDAALKDTASIAAYGQREEWITLNTTDLTAAKNYAKRFLAARKDIQWTAVGQLAVNGYIRSSSGQRVPSSQIQPGKRVKIENWLNDLSGSGLTFLITGTTYTDASEACAMDIGLPNTLEVMLLRMQK